MVLLLGMNIIGYFLCKIVSFTGVFSASAVFLHVRFVFSGIGGCFQFCFPDKNKME